MDCVHAYPPSRHQRMSALDDRRRERGRSWDATEHSRIPRSSWPSSWLILEPAHPRPWRERAIGLAGAARREGGGILGSRGSAGGFRRRGQSWSVPAVPVFIEEVMLASHGLPGIARDVPRVPGSRVPCSQRERKRSIPGVLNPSHGRKVRVTIFLKCSRHFPFGSVFPRRSLPWKEISRCREFQISFSLKVPGALFRGNDLASEQGAFLGRRLLLERVRLVDHRIGRRSEPCPFAWRVNPTPSTGACPTMSRTNHRLSPRNASCIPRTVESILDRCLIGYRSARQPAHGGLVNDR